MNYYAVTEKEENISLLTSEYKAGREIGVIRVGEGYLFFRKFLKVFYIPYKDIRRCYRRVLMVPARMCCGRGELNIENLVVEGEKGEIAQIELPGQRAAVELMKVLETKLPHAQFGCPAKSAAAPQEG